MMKNYIIKKFRHWSNKLSRLHPDVTLVMQGPTNWVGYSNIANYLLTANLIISTYEGSCVGTEEQYPEVVVVRNPPLEPPAFDDRNLFRQSYTTYHGLVKVKTPWAVKIRSDESYANMDYFIRKMKEFPAGITTNNVFFHSAENHPFHISDHVIGGKTEDLTGMFKHALEFAQGRWWTPGHIQGTELGMGWYRQDLSTESILCLSYLFSKKVGFGNLGERMNYRLIKDIMKNNIRMVTLEEMGPFVWSCNSKERRLYFTDSDKNFLTSMEQV